MKRYSRKYINQIFPTNDGYDALVVDGGSKKSYCTIKIKDWISEVEVRELKKGKIKYPYHPSVHGVGYMGEGKYKTSANGMYSEQYRAWQNMLKRCYSSKYQERRPTYIGCSVDSRWHNLQAFGDWFDQNHTSDWHLDKDLLIKDNKIYSPDACIFIPSRLNSFMANKNSSNTSGYTGVSWNEPSRKYAAQISDVTTGKSIYLGYFDDPKEASKAYIKTRAKMADKMRIIMSEEYGITNSRILNAIR